MGKGAQNKMKIQKRDPAEETQEGTVFGNLHQEVQKYYRRLEKITGIPYSELLSFYFRHSLYLSSVRLKSRLGD